MKVIYIDFPGDPLGYLYSSARNLFITDVFIEGGLCLHVDTGNIEAELNHMLPYILVQHCAELVNMQADSVTT